MQRQHFKAGINEVHNYLVCLLISFDKHWLIPRWKLAARGTAVQIPDEIITLDVGVMFPNLPITGESNIGTLPPHVRTQHQTRHVLPHFLAFHFWGGGIQAFELLGFAHRSTKCMMPAGWFADVGCNSDRVKGEAWCEALLCSSTGCRERLTKGRFWKHYSENH